MEADNKTYLAAAAPLEKSQTLITSFLLLIVLVSAVVLSLILTMWSKSRIHETGVLLSIGFGKASIIGQYLAEVLLIAAIAFGLSFFSGSLIAGRIGNSLLQLQYTREQSIQEPDEGENGVQVSRKSDMDPDVVISDNGNGGEPIPNKDFPEPLSVSVGLDSMVKLYLIGFAIITFSVGVSSAAVMRLKPGEILAKMS